MSEAEERNNYRMMFKCKFCNDTGQLPLATSVVPCDNCDFYGRELKSIDLVSFSAEIPLTTRIYYDGNEKKHDL